MFEFELVPRTVQAFQHAVPFELPGQEGACTLDNIIDVW